MASGMLPSLCGNHNQMESMRAPQPSAAPTTEYTIRKERYRAPSHTYWGTILDPRSLVSVDDGSSTPAVGGVRVLCGFAELAVVALVKACKQEQGIGRKFADGGRKKTSWGKRLLGSGRQLRPQLTVGQRPPWGGGGGGLGGGFWEARGGGSGGVCLAGGGGSGTVGWRGGGSRWGDLGGTYRVQLGLGIGIGSPSWCNQIWFYNPL